MQGEHTEEPAKRGNSSVLADIAITPRVTVDKWRVATCRSVKNLNALYYGVEVVEPEGWSALASTVISDAKLNY